MKEAMLRDFFAGAAGAEALAADLDGARTVGADTSRYSIEPGNDGAFGVTPAHLVKVCDAFLAGMLTGEHLRIIGFSLLSSDFFAWQGDDAAQETLAVVASDWATPEINFPIVRENVEKWRRLLQGEKHAFSPLKSVR